MKLKQLFTALAVMTIGTSVFASCAAHKLPKPGNNLSEIHSLIKYDAHGFDKNGYNKHGLDRNGFDESGHDNRGDIISSPIN
jgi:hypothetical protein